MRQKRRNGKPIITTMRLTNKYRENGGEWYLDYDDKKMLAYIKKDLAAARAEEPDRDWHLETRGTHVGWHRIADPERLFGKNPSRRYRRNTKRVATKRIMKSFYKAGTEKGQERLLELLRKRHGYKRSWLKQGYIGHPQAYKKNPRKRYRKARR